MLSRFSAVAVFYGLAAAYVTATLITMLTAVLLYPPAGLDVSNPIAVASWLAGDPRFLTIALLGAWVAAFVAGNVAASLTPGDELPNALATGVALLGVTTLGPQQISFASLPAWHALVTGLLALPLCVLGGLHRRGPATA